MKYLKWLLNLASGKPLIFSLALLLVAVMALGAVVIDRDKKLNNCIDNNKTLEDRYNYKLDSINTYYKQREKDLSAEIKETLAMVIEDYKNQVGDQKSLIDKLYFTIMMNDRILKENKTKIQKLQR